MMKLRPVNRRDFLRLTALGTGSLAADLWAREVAAS